MRYLSLFSGIESASVAWNSLGWQCAALAEMDPFASSVLAYRYPNVPNLGDITKITRQQIEALGPVDLTVGGFPCQDLSLAGNRKGLINADGTLTRSGLFFTAVEIADWARSRWLLVENVPGLFSSNEGRDFAAVVGELAGLKFDVPPDGWANAGVALGPKGLVEWATLDAQYCRVDTHPRAVPQRRRRVFIVRDSGTQWERRPPVFLIPQSMRGDPAPRRGSGQRIAPPVEARAGASRAGGGGWGTDFLTGGGMTTDVAHPLLAKSNSSHLPDHDTYVSDVCPTLSESGGHARPGDNVQSAGTLIPMVMAHGQGNAEIGEDKSPSLSCNDEAPILFAQEVADPLTASEQKTYTHEGEKNFRTRNVVAFSSKDHGADAQEEVSPTLRAGGHDASHANAGVPPAICFKPSHFTRDKDGAPSEVSPPLSADADKGDQDTVVLAFDTTQITNKDNRSNPQSGDPCHTLSEGGHPPAIAFSSRMRGDDGRGYERPMQSSEEVVGAIDTVTRQCVAIQDVRGIDKKQNGSGVNDDGSAYTVDAHATQGVAVEAHAFQQRIARNGRGDTGDVVGALNAQAGSVGQGDAAPCVAVSFKPRHYSEKGYKDGAPNVVTGALTANASDAGDCSPHVATEMVVRRLTPTECERLQGFQDGFTKIPKFDKVTGCVLIGQYAADGPRYKVLGNSMATNVMRWIGKRLIQLEALTSKSSTPS